MKRLWLQQIEAFKVMMGNINHFLSYQIISSIILLLLISPLFKYIANALLKWRGYEYFTNDVIKSFLLSPQGILLGLFAVVIGSLIVLLQLGGLIILSNQVIDKREIPSFVSITKYCFKRLKYMLGLDGFIVALYFVIIAPLLNQSVTASVFESLKIPGFVMQVITSNFYYLTALSLLVVLIIYLTCRWLFGLHILMLEADGTKKFLTKSRQMIKGHYMEIFQRGLLSMIMVGGLIIGFLVFLALVGVILATLSISPLIIIGILIVLLAMFIMFVIMIVIPMDMIRLTIFYHDVKGEIPMINLPGKKHQSKRISSILMVFLILIASVAIVGLDLFVWVTDYEANLESVQVTAHRGSSIVAPENTMSAIEIAANNGADFVEIDVQLTKDNEIILLHDTTFKRTAGLDKRPDELTLDEIRQLEVGAWFDEKYNGEPVPTLKEVISKTRGKLRLNIEIKGAAYSPDIYQVLADILYEESIADDAVITSLEYDDLQAMETIDPSFRTGYIMFVALGNLESLNVDFYSVEASNINDSFVDRAHALNREVHVWTINEEDQMLEMIAFGVDNIITDEDVILIQLLREGR